MGCAFSRATMRSKITPAKQDTSTFGMPGTGGMRFAGLMTARGFCRIPEAASMRPLYSGMNPL